jgi:hypothetical protein
MKMNTYRLMAATVLAGLVTAPVFATATDYCIEVGGGFGSGGTSFVGREFTMPTAGNCAQWSGFTKTASSVVLTTYGSGCLSSNGKVLTLSLASADPSWFGAGNVGNDYIQVCPSGSSGCPFSSGSDQGSFSGVAKPETCTSSLLNLPATHD